MEVTSEVSLKTLHRIEIKDLNQYLTDWMNNEYNNKLIVGCDSIQQGPKTVYISTVVLYNEGHGGNILYMQDEVKRIPDSQRFDRLFKEVLKASALAQYIQKVLEENKKYIPITVHIDINSKENTGSNNVYDAGVGMIKSLGFECFGKPDSWAASHVADMIAKGKQNRNRPHGNRKFKKKNK